MTREEYYTLIVANAVASKKRSSSPTVDEWQDEIVTAVEALRGLPAEYTERRSGHERRAYDAPDAPGGTVPHRRITAARRNRSRDAIPEFPVVLAVSIAAAPPGALVAGGATYTFEAGVTYGPHSNPDFPPAEVSWTSNDPARASFADPLDGTLTPLTSGTVTITASAEGVRGSLAVPISSTSATPTSVTITEGTTFNLAIGGTQQLTPVVRDQFGVPLTGRTFSWLSSNLSVATVSASGLVAGVAGGGPVTVTVTDDASSLEASAAITVSVASTPATVVVSPSVVVLSVGSTVQLVARTYDQFAVELPGRTYQWVNANTAGTITLSTAGLVTGVAEGTGSVYAVDVTIATPRPQSSLVGVTVQAAPISGTAPSPTGRMPTYWNSTRQWELDQMEAAWTTSPTSTLAARIYAGLLDCARRTGGSATYGAERSGDNGRFCALIYQATGDTTFASRGITRMLNSFFASSAAAVDNNGIRNLGLFIQMADMYYPAMTAAQRSTFMGYCHLWVDEALGRNGGTGQMAAYADTDNFTAVYLGLLIVDQWNVPENDLYGTLANAATSGGQQMGGFTSTSATLFTTLRNGFRFWVEYASGGEWMESASYNCFSTMHVIGYTHAIREVVPSFAPEVDTMASAMAYYLPHGFYNGWGNQERWGDLEGGFQQNYSDYRVFLLMSAVAFGSRNRTNGTMAQQAVLDLAASLEAARPTFFSAYTPHWLADAWFHWDVNAPAGGAYPFTGAESWVTHAKTGHAILNKNQGTTLAFLRGPYFDKVKSLFHHVWFAYCDFVLRHNNETVVDHPNGYGGGAQYTDSHNTIILQGMAIAGIYSGPDRFETGTVGAVQWYALTCSNSGQYDNRITSTAVPPTIINKVQTRMVTFIDPVTGYLNLIIYDDLDIEDPTTLSPWPGGANVYPAPVQAKITAAQLRAGPYAKERNHFCRVNPTVSPGLATYTSAGGQTVRHVILSPAGVTPTVYPSQTFMAASTSPIPSEFTLNPQIIRWSHPAPYTKANEFATVVQVGSGAPPATALVGGNPKVIQVAGITFTMNATSITAV